MLHFASTSVFVFFCYHFIHYDSSALGSPQLYINFNNTNIYITYYYSHILCFRLIIFRWDLLCYIITIVYHVYIFIFIMHCGQTFDTLVAEALHRQQICHSAVCFRESYIYIHRPPVQSITLSCFFFSSAEFEEIVYYRIQ